MIDGRFFCRSRPAWNLLPGDDAHGLADRDVDYPVRLVDPSPAVEPFHFSGVEPFHVAARVRLQPGSRIVGQRQRQIPIAQRARIKDPNDGAQKNGQGREHGGPGPDEALSDVSLLAARGLKGLFRHRAAPLRPFRAAAALAEPARRQCR